MDRVRFRSLDVFRGMAICLMIVVNTPGAGSEPWQVVIHPNDPALVKKVSGQ